MKYLYKFVDYTGLLSIINCEKLLFRKPSSWCDKRENFMINCFNYHEAFDKLIATYRKNNLTSHAMITNLAQLNLFSNSTYAICFTNPQNRDSAAMWQIYNYNNCALRLKFDSTFIDTLDHTIPYGELHIYHNKINYVKNLDIEYITSNQLKAVQINPMFFIKSNSFKFENETRIVAVPWSIREDFMINLTHINSNMYSEEDITFMKMNKIFKELGFGTFNNQNEIYIGFNKSKLISIQVHPLAQQSYVDFIKNFCEINSIDFEGKSNLFDIPFK